MKKRILLIVIFLRMAQKRLRRYVYVIVIEYTIDRSFALSKIFQALIPERQFDDIEKGPAWGNLGIRSNL